MILADVALLRQSEVDMRTTNTAYVEECSKEAAGFCWLFKGRLHWKPRLVGSHTSMQHKTCTVYLTHAYVAFKIITVDS